MNKKRYCLTYEYPGICWAFDNPNPRIFYEVDNNYNMTDIQIKGVVNLTFKCWVDNLESVWYL